MTEKDVAAGLRKAHVPSVALARIEQGKVALVAAYGLADPDTGTEAGADTLYTVASVSKLVTMTTLMRLWDRGLFRLDDDIDLYLPFKVRAPSFPDTPITFRMLFAHVAGIADGPAYGRSYTTKKAGTGLDCKIALGDFLEGYFVPGGKYYDARRNFTGELPGRSYGYSNVAYGLLAYLAERISRKDFRALSSEEVFLPLGMDSSAWSFSDVDLSRMALPCGWDLLRGKPRVIGFTSFATYPDGALKTSARDFSRFLATYAKMGIGPDGKPYLSAAAMSEVFRVQYPDSGAAVGLAWHRGSRGWGHSGGDPGITTLCAVFPESEAAYLVFTNADSAGFSASGRITRFMEGTGRFLREGAVPAPESD